VANTVTVNVKENGPRNVQIHVFLQSDGVTGDLAGQVLLDPVVDLGMEPGQRLMLSRVDYNLAGFDAVLEFGSGGVTPNFKWVLVEGANNPQDFVKWGHIQDNSGMDGTGKLQLTTYGFTSTSDVGSMLVWLLKAGNV